jgi:hypothetical protein
VPAAHQGRAQRALVLGVGDGGRGEGLGHAVAFEVTDGTHPGVRHANIA